MGRPQTPALAVDVIAELVDRPGRPIVLIERCNPPPGWAIPGGFVDIGETVENAALRELREETGLEGESLRLLGVYSDPGRDPRGHTVSAVYVADCRGEPMAGDDAAAVIVVDPREPPDMAFDHGSILKDYLRRFRRRDSDPPGSLRRQGA
jgi:8-oxo-dGTP diphosphatase